MKNELKKQKKRQKRTHLTGAELNAMRREMKFAPRDMCAILSLPRRTYQDYESGRRSIPEKVAAQIREAHRQDREFIAGIGARIDQYKDNNELSQH